MIKILLYSFSLGTGADFSKLVEFYTSPLFQHERLWRSLLLLGCARRVSFSPCSLTILLFLLLPPSPTYKNSRSPHIFRIAKQQNPKKTVFRRRWRKRKRGSGKNTRFCGGRNTFVFCKDMNYERKMGKISGTPPKKQYGKRWLGATAI